MLFKKKESKGESVEQLAETRNHIKEMLSSLEGEYNSASISESSYNEIKGKNLKKLEEIESKIKEMGGSVEEPKPVINGHYNKKEKAEKPVSAESQTSEALEQPSPKTKEKKGKKKLKAGTLGASLTDVPGYQGSPVEGESEGGDETQEEPSVKEAKAKEVPDSKKTEETTVPIPISAKPDAGIEKEFNRINFELERLKLLLESTKETRGIVDERLQRLTENIGELRSMIYQKEGQIDELEVKTQRVEEIITSVKPENFTKELSKRDTQISNLELRMEKAEAKIDEMLRIVKDVQKVMSQMGNLDNVVDVGRKTADKLLKMQNLADSTERYSKNIQKLYVDISRGLEEIERVKASHERIDGSLKDMTNSVDSLNTKIEKYATLGDLNDLREAVALSSREVDNVKNFVSSRIPVLETLSEPLKKFKEEKEELEVILSSLDEKHSEGKIKDDEYKALRGANEKKLVGIEKQIKKEWRRIEKTRKNVGAPIPSSIKPPKEEIKADKLTEEPEVVEQPAKEKESQGKITKKERHEERVEPLPMKKSIMEELDDLLNKGLITKQAYERTKITLSKKA